MKRAILILGLLLSASGLRAGEDEAVYRLDQSEGLSDNCVNDVLMDSRNLLWAATNAGLDFYDGCNMVHVAFPDAENDLHPVVFALAEDSSGTLWAGTSDGLYHMAGDRLEMRLFSCPELGRSSIRQMCCGRDGFLWIAIKEHNLVRIDTSDGTVSSVPVVATAICCSPGGSLYGIAGDRRLFVLKDGVSDPEYLPAGINDVVSELEVSRIAVAGPLLFVSAAGDATYACNMSDGNIVSLSSVNRVRDVIMHAPGEYWLAARDGIHVFDSALVHSHVLRPFHDNAFRCLSEDRNGGVWAGTLFEGLAHIAHDNNGFRHYSDSFAGGRFKARDFAETPDGRIWIGSDTKGLLCLDSRNGNGRAAVQYLPGRNVTGLMAEGSSLWIGTIDNELPVTLLDTDSGKMTFFPNAGKSAYAFCRDASGRLWVGGKDGFVVGRDGPHGAFSREIFIPCAQVCRIICTADASVWVASISGQILRYRANDFSTYKIPTSNILTDISEDREGRIFAISEGGGLWEYNPGEDSFQSRAVAETRLLKIAREPDGNLLWITGAHGIHVFNPDDSRSMPIISREALEIDSFNYSSNFISSNGMLYAGTSDGFISISAKQIAGGSQVAGAPVISSLHILSSLEKTNGDRFICPSSLNIGRKSRSFEVNVSPLDYSRFPNSGLFWKIDSFSDWTPVKGGTFTVYDIPTGKWELKVKALSFSGVESPETVMELRVQTPRFLSPTAVLLYLVLFLLLMTGIAVVSDRRAKIKAAREHERKLLESKMDFLTSIAHEIRTPLSLVQIPLEALIRKFSSSPDGSVQENLDIMRRNSLKLTVLINELLDFRKLSDSTFQVHPEYLDIRGVLKDAHRRFLPMFLQEGKTLSVKVPDAAVYCETDVRSLGRIFDNLLSNALKYSSHHTVITLSVNGHDAVVCVENDGTVLPEDVRELIFRPFYRYEDNASSNVEGTGLGLSTSRQFASLLGGSLSMDEDLTTNRFIFTLPLTSDEGQESVLPKVDAKDKSVMVVEDDRDMARVIGDILSDAYGIIYASNGRQALEKIDSGASPTIIVSDVIMPEMDGIALTRALKSNLATSHIPVILLSAEVPDTLMQESLEGGADAYLEKPFSPKKLRSTVDNLIENRRRIYEFYISSLPSSGELPAGRVSALEQKFLRSIQEYVSANLHKNITLDDIAEVVCMSPSSLYKKMKEYADISPMEYVMKMRLHKAVELLKDDSVSVQEVAQSVGFNTHSFFSECFKREFGMTPRQWRLRNVTKVK